MPGDRHPTINTAEFPSETQLFYCLEIMTPEELTPVENHTPEKATLLRNPQPETPQGGIGDRRTMTGN